MKKKILASVILLLFSMQMISQVASYTDRSYSMIQEKNNQIILSKQSRNSEELKVLIGMPNTIDENDSIPIIVAGIRDAKATYIKPLRIKIDLLSINLSTSQVYNDDQILIASKESWYFKDQWISENENSSIKKLNDFLYQTEFKPLNQEVTIEIKVYFDWVAPWNEIFTSTNNKIIGLGKWRNYTQYLKTNADSVRTTTTESFQQDVENATEVLTDVQNKINDLQTYIDSKQALSDLGVQDPSFFHFYLLNISTIVDWTNPNILSYVEQLPNTSIYLDGKTERQYYKDILNKTNQAFIDSLSILDKKKIPYTITNVNYTYTNTNYNDTIDYLGQVANAVDGDWDDENLIDTSFEFLLEGTGWSGHPDHVHQNLFVKYNGTPVGSYTLKELLEQYNADVLNPILQKNYDGTNSIWKGDQTFPYDDGNDNPTNSHLQYINLYEGFVTIYSKKNDNITLLEEGIDYTLDNSTGITFLKSQYGSDILMDIEKPGGWRKENKGIIVNLMGDLFPIMNHFYTIPRGLSDPNPQTDYNEYYIDPTNENFISPPIKECSFNSSITGEIGIENLEENINSELLINENQYINLTDYVYYLYSLSSGTPYWINTIMKPFSKLVYDNNIGDGDSYNNAYNETHFNTYIKNFYKNFLSNDTEYNIRNISLFSLLDLTIKFSGGIGHVQPHQSNNWDVFYKNRWGDWIDSFFNGTNLLNGNDRTNENYTGPDSSYSYPNSWTFKYIDYEVSSVDSQSLPSEFTLSPFQGPSDFTPLGVMTLQNVMFMQNSLLNITAGFGYLYGLIYNIYRRAYDANKLMLLQLQQQMIQKNNTEGSLSVQSDIELLDQSWEDLDLKTLDKIGVKINDYLNNPNNEYTSENGKSLYQNMIKDLKDSVNTAVDKLGSHEKDANSIDDSLTGTSYDVRKLGILEEVTSYLQNQILPWLDGLEGTTSNLMQDFTSNFNDTIDSIPNSFNSSIESINNTINGWFDVFISGVHNFTDKINESTLALASGLKRSINNIYSSVIGIGIGLGAVGVITLAFGIGELASKEYIAGVKDVAIGILLIASGAILIYEAAQAMDNNIIDQYVSNLGYKISGSINNVADKVYDGMSRVEGSVMQSLYKASDAIATVGNRLKETVTTISTVITNIVGKMSDIASLLIDQVILIIKAINETLNLVKNIIIDIFEKIGEVYNEVKEVFAQISNFIIDIMGESLGRVKDIMSEAAGNLFDKLKFVGEKIKNHSAFVKIEDLYNKIKFASVSAGYSLYSASYSKLDESQVLRWASTMQPLAEIQSADTGFYVFQMGNEFSEELYYAIVYQGKLIDPNVTDFRIRRFVDLSEYGGSGEDIFEAYPIIHKFRTNESDPSTEIDGLYYLNFTEGQRIQWYRTNSTNPYVESAAPAGNYLTIFNCTLTNRPEWNGEDIQSYWVEKTVLYTKEYITDAFPIINIDGYNPNNPESFIIKAGSESQLFSISIENKMWSNPYVQVDFILTTQSNKESVEDGIDGGTTLAQLQYNNVPLYPEESAEIAVEWDVGKYTPSGNHQLLIVVTEVNGDVTIISVPVKVEQSNVLIDFIGSFFTSGWGFGSIALVIVITLVGFSQMSKRNTKIKKIIPKL